VIVAINVGSFCVALAAGLEIDLDECEDAISLVMDVLSHSVVSADRAAMLGTVIEAMRSYGVARSIADLNDEGMRLLFMKDGGRA
jgi:hypothetical protein